MGPDCTAKIIGWYLRGHVGTRALCQRGYKQLFSALEAPYPSHIDVGAIHFEVELTPNCDGKRLCSTTW